MPPTLKWALVWGFLIVGVLSLWLADRHAGSRAWEVLTWAGLVALLLSAAVWLTP